MSQYTIKKLKAFDPDTDLSCDEFFNISGGVSHSILNSDRQPAMPLPLKHVEVKSSVSVSAGGPVRGGLARIDAFGERDIFASGNEKGEVYFVEPRKSRLAVIGKISLAGSIVSSLIFHEGLLCCVTKEGTVYGISTTPSENSPGGISNRIAWKRKMKKGILTEPAAAPGTVVITPFDGLYALSVNEASGRAAGSALWGASISGTVSTPRIYQGIIIIGTEDRRLLALDCRSGKLSQLWEAYLGGQCRSKPAVAPVSGLAAAGTVEGNVLCFELESGSGMWSSQVKSPVLCGISSGESSRGECFFFGTESGVFYSFSSSGEKVWSFSAGAPIMSEALVYNGMVFFGCGENSLVCLDADTGTELFRFATEGAVCSPPLVYGSSLFFGTVGGLLYRLYIE